MTKSLCIHVTVLDQLALDEGKEKRARELTGLLCDQRGSSPCFARDCAGRHGRACEETTPATGFSRQHAFEWHSNHSEHLSGGCQMWRGGSHGWLDTSSCHAKLPVSHSLLAVTHRCGCDVTTVGVTLIFFDMQNWKSEIPLSVQLAASCSFPSFSLHLFGQQMANDYIQYHWNDQNEVCESGCSLKTCTFASLAEPTTTQKSILVPI